MQVGLLSDVCSFSKLIRMICVILSFQIGCTLVGVSICKSLTFVSALKMGIIEVKKSAFNNWSTFYQFGFEVTIRVVKVMRCAKITIAYIAGVSSIQSCFSQVSVLVNRHRAGIALISPTHLYILLNGMLATYSIKLSVKRINPSGPMKIFHQLALIAGCL